MSDKPQHGAGRRHEGRRAMSDTEAKDPAPAAPGNGAQAERELPAAARRALAEAEERRRRADAEMAASQATEINGPKGPEPIRYGDWEKNGLISDF